MTHNKTPHPVQDKVLIIKLKRYLLNNVKNQGYSISTPAYNLYIYIIYHYKLKDNNKKYFRLFENTFENGNSSPNPAKSESIIFHLNSKTIQRHYGIWILC